MSSVVETSDRSERVALKPKVGLPLPNTMKENQEQKWKCMIYSSTLCVISIFGTFVYCFVNWYDGVFEEREEIDRKITVISEKWLDYETNEQINCTNDHTCLYNCSYIGDHFHKTPGECVYKDYYNMISIIVEIGLALCICSCICGNKK